MAIRQRFWVDHEVQGVLVGRVVLYWFFGIIFLTSSVAITRYYEHPEWPTERHAYALVGELATWAPSLLVVLPLLMFDIVRVSNLFAGPIFRLRKHLELMASGKECPPMKFREGDYWQDLANPINNLQLEISDLKSELRRLRAEANRRDPNRPDRRSRKAPISSDSPEVATSSSEIPSSAFLVSKEASEQSA